MFAETILFLYCSQALEEERLFISPSPEMVSRPFSSSVQVRLPQVPEPTSSAKADELRHRNKAMQNNNARTLYNVFFMTNPPSVLIYNIHDNSIEDCSYQ